MYIYLYIFRITLHSIIKAAVQCFLKKKKKKTKNAEKGNKIRKKEKRKE